MPSTHRRVQVHQIRQSKRNKYYNYFTRQDYLHKIESLLPRVPIIWPVGPPDCFHPLFFHSSGTQKRDCLSETCGFSMALPLLLEESLHPACVDTMWLVYYRSLWLQRLYCSSQSGSLYVCMYVWSEWQNATGIPLSGPRPTGCHMGAHWKPQIC